MKNLILFALIFGSASAQAASSYTCTDQDGNVAELTLFSKKSISWSEPWHSADSDGVFVGKESAPFDSERGYLRYELVSFFNTQDSAHYVALSSTNGKIIRAVTYFDNDDHKEEITSYVCRKN